MDQVEIFKALSNRTRLQMLNWLKQPAEHFPEQDKISVESNGVCVGLIQKKTGLTQSTVSEYLFILQRAGLLQATRTGQWTYYKRNEEALAAFIKDIETNL